MRTSYQLQWFFATLFHGGHLLFTWKIATVWNFTSVNLAEVKFAPKWVSLLPKSCERWQWSYLTPSEILSQSEISDRFVWVQFTSQANLLLMWRFQAVESVSICFDSYHPVVIYQKFTGKHLCRSLYF